MQACVARCLWMIEDCEEFTLRQDYSSQKQITKVMHKSEIYGENIKTTTIWATSKLEKSKG